MLARLADTGAGDDVPRSVPSAGSLHRHESTRCERLIADDYLHDLFQPTARATAGLEKALEAGGHSRQREALGPVGAGAQRPGLGSSACPVRPTDLRWTSDQGALARFVMPRPV
ncbi:hypothetical protein GCM10010289_84660 [Streptomyces violascens]|uniref:Uncharacterized protein n=1 Tax=Streptomyces violascens TaxID=67381 RepID=A0ABQ3QS19_9ACTN|nr:hypothetical protein GCM10010289_84660 [Streptomyces violascens]GHI40077.1 hypothetical protein Sviol_44850 [Streptomyces violascens]